MKITDVTCYPLSEGRRNYLFVVVDTDEGIYGVGESGLTGRELAVRGAIEHFKPLLIGQNPMRTEHLWQVLSRGGFFPHGKVLGSAIAAIDIALWDIKGKALGVPVYDLLGGRVRDKVVCYCHLRGGDKPGVGLVEDAKWAWPSTTRSAPSLPPPVCSSTWPSPTLPCRSNRPSRARP